MSNSIVFFFSSGGLGALGMQSIAALNQLAGVANSSSAASGKTRDDWMIGVKLVLGWTPSGLT